MTKGTKKNSAMVRIYTLSHLLLRGEVVLTEVGFEICSFSFNLSVVPVYAFVLESITFLLVISELFFLMWKTFSFIRVLTLCRC